MEMGAEKGNTATLAFTFSTSSTVSRTWEIKASQIPCGANYKAPDGCLQYFVGQTGRVMTFNFQVSTNQIHLPNQNYGICIRQEAGHCCVQYELCGDDRSWSIDSTDATKNEIDTQCATDYVGIDGAGLTCSTSTSATLHSRICGGIFNLEKDLANAATTICGEYHFLHFFE